MIDLDRTPSAGELRWFGLLFALFTGVVGAIVLWQFESRTAATVVWAGGLSFAALYQLARPWRLTLYRGWLRATFPIGWTVSTLVLAFCYYVVVTPIGLGLRLAGRDPLARQRKSSATSYWIERPRTRDRSHYFKQY